MSFVNEYISKADIEKYNIEEVNRKYHKHNPNPDWTIDRQREMYLRYLHNEREEHSNRHTYYFYWKGAVLILVVDITGGGVMNGEQWRHYTMWNIEIPEILKPQEAEIFADLKEAFVAYKELGIRSDSTKHTATFNF